MSLFRSLEAWKPANVSTSSTTSNTTALLKRTSESLATFAKDSKKAFQRTSDIVCAPLESITSPNSWIIGPDAICLYSSNSVFDPSIPLHERISLLRAQQQPIVEFKFLLSFFLIQKEELLPKAYFEWSKSYLKQESNVKDVKEEIKNMILTIETKPVFCYRLKSKKETTSVQFNAIGFNHECVNILEILTKLYNGYIEQLASEEAKFVKFIEEMSEFAPKTILLLPKSRETLKSDFLLPKLDPDRIFIIRSIYQFSAHDFIQSITVASSIEKELEYKFTSLKFEIESLIHNFETKTKELEAKLKEAQSRPTSAPTSFSDLKNMINELKAMGEKNFEELKKLIQENSPKDSMALATADFFNTFGLDQSI